MERISKRSVDELNMKKFFSMKRNIRRNCFSTFGFNRCCWGSRDYLFIEWIIDTS